MGSIHLPWKVQKKAHGIMKALFPQVIQGPPDMSSLISSHKKMMGPEKLSCHLLPSLARSLTKRSLLSTTSTDLNGWLHKLSFVWIKSCITPVQSDATKNRIRLDVATSNIEASLPEDPNIPTLSGWKVDDIYEKEDEYYKEEWSVLLQVKELLD